MRVVGERDAVSGRGVVKEFQVEVADLFFADKMDDHLFWRRLYALKQKRDLSPDQRKVDVKFSLRIIKSNFQFKEEQGFWGGL